MFYFIKELFILLAQCLQFLKMNIKLFKSNCYDLHLLLSNSSTLIAVCVCEQERQGERKEANVILLTIIEFRGNAYWYLFYHSFNSVFKKKFSKRHFGGNQIKNVLKSYTLLQFHILFIQLLLCHKYFSSVLKILLLA